MTETADLTAQRPPLFYRALELVSSEAHRDWRLADGDYRFAAETAYVPIVTGEFAPVARHYPILFAQGEVPTPVALLGLEETNLFVTGGAWAEHVHVPAYVRRYPFAYAQPEPDRFVLAIDAASERVLRGGEAGAPLFEDGKASDLTLQALAFCEAFRADAMATNAFCIALREAGLLAERRADVTTPDGARFGVQGFALVDLERFAALDADRLVDWHRRGWLALVQHHLASLDHFQTLLARKMTREPAAA